MAPSRPLLDGERAAIGKADDADLGARVILWTIPILIGWL